MRNHWNQEEYLFVREKCIIEEDKKDEDQNSDSQSQINFHGQISNVDIHYQKFSPGSNS